jgi:hypothetical protein
MQDINSNKQEMARHLEQADVLVRPFLTGFAAWNGYEQLRGIIIFK